MIVDMYFSSVYADYVGYNRDSDYSQMLKKGNDAVVNWMKELPDHTRFVFLVTNSQMGRWNKWIEEYELKDLIRFSLPRPITNYVHKDSGRVINLFILSKTPLTEEEYGNTNQG